MEEIEYTNDAAVGKPVRHLYDDMQPDEALATVSPTRPPLWHPVITLLHTDCVVTITAIKTFDAKIILQSMIAVLDDLLCA